MSLERWEAGREYDRLGLQAEKFLILEQEMPSIRMPVAPGRNLAILVEVAARNQLLKERGYDAARRFVERVDEMIEANGAPPPSPAAAAAGRAGGRDGPARRAAAGRRRAATRRSRRRPALGGAPARGPPQRAAHPRHHRASAVRARRTWRAPSRTAAGSAWTTCPARSSRASPTSSATPPSCTARPWSWTCASATSCKQFPHVFRQLRAKGVAASVLFLEAEEKVLQRRFSETRRPHPLAINQPAIEGIREEREALRPIRKMADLILDTSRLHRPPAPRLHPRALRRARRAVAPGAVRDVVRLQVRRALGGGPRVRRALPAQPELRARA